MVEGGLLRSRSGNAELGLTLLNRLQQPLWVSMHFQTPEGLTDCVLFKELEPGGDRLFVCPQPTVHARVRYPIHIKVFASVDQSEPIETIDTSLKFKDADVQAL